jgi:hypothetical protein
MTILDDILGDPTKLIAFCALVISVVTVISSFIGLWIQRQHNRLSVRPLGNIGYLESINYAEKIQKISLNINNNGIGPMIITSVETLNSEGIKKGYPLDWFSPEDRIGMEFWAKLENIALPAGQHFQILGYSYNSESSEQKQKKDKIKSVLEGLTIRIKYTDIYDKNQKEIIQQLGALINL